MTGQGFKITTSSLIFLSNVKEWKEPIQFKLSMSIKNCQAIKRSCIDRKYKAPAKRSQHVNATYRNIVGRNMLCAFGHHVAMCWVLLAQV